MADFEKELHPPVTGGGVLLGAPSTVEEAVVSGELDLLSQPTQRVMAPSRHFRHFRPELWHEAFLKPHAGLAALPTALLRCIADQDKLRDKRRSEDVHDPTPSSPVEMAATWHSCRNTRTFTSPDDGTNTKPSPVLATISHLARQGLGLTDGAMILFPAQYVIFRSLFYVHSGQKQTKARRVGCILPAILTIHGAHLCILVDDDGGLHRDNSNP
jgi:hypothetical protein